VKTITLCALLVSTVVLVGGVQAGDSPRFRGPAGDGVFAETGLLKQWPEGGPKLVWSADGLGPGYSSAVVVKGTVYITGMDDQKQGHLIAFTLDGPQKWKTAYGPELGKTGPAPGGTRGTPTVDGDRAFLQTGFAKLVILDAGSGALLKTVDLLDRFGAGQAKFGFAEGVLVDGRRVICTPGGTDASLVALDRDTGDAIWQSTGLSEPAGYCTPRFISHGGRKIVVTMLSKSVAAVDPETGKVLWEYPYPNRFGVMPNPPLYADGMLYVCAGGGTGGAMLALADDGGGVTPGWTDRTLDCQMHGTVLVDGCIYGTAQSANRGLVCLDWKTGEVRWNAGDVKQAAVVAADGMLYVYGQDGTVRLVKPNPEAFEPAGQFTVAAGDGEHWAHPTVANGRLYIRHGDVLLVYDVKAGS
jgi:outer membrane protein assembly factor BamB